MILTTRISITKLLHFTRGNLLMLAGFVVIANVLCWYAGATPYLQRLSFAAGFLGSALAFLIGFRNNAAYGRWWEGQKLWSQLKYDSRQFALMAQGYVQCNDQQTSHSAVSALVHRQIAFLWWLNAYLRKLPPDAENLKALTQQERRHAEQQQTPPLALLQGHTRQLATLFRDGALDSYKHSQLQTMVGRFNSVLGSCERLKKTPFPMQYSWFMRYGLVVFLALVSLSLAGHLGLWSIPLSFLIGYTFIMLEYVGRHVEHPFENTVNDVPMNYIARAVEIDLRQLLGETELPPAVTPQGRGYLY